MFVLGNVVVAFAGLIHAVFQIAWWTLLARIVLSWIRPNPSAPLLRSIVSAIYRLTDPVLDRARRALPFLVVGGLDLSPIAVFLGLGFVDQVVYQTLLQIGYGLG